MPKSSGIAQVIGVSAWNVCPEANPHLACVDRLSAFHIQRERQRVPGTRGNVGMSSNAFASKLTQASGNSFRVGSNAMQAESGETFQVVIASE
jgi:hypothetical protein